MSNFNTTNTKFWGLDLLIVVEIEIESELEDLEIKGCWEPFKFRKLLSREENDQQIYQELKIYLHYGFFIHLNHQ